MARENTAEDGEFVGGEHGLGVQGIGEVRGEKTGQLRLTEAAEKCIVKKFVTFIIYYVLVYIFSLGYFYYNTRGLTDRPDGRGSLPPGQGTPSTNTQG